jgi:hypothetical protein
MTLNYGIFDVSDPQNPDRVYSAALLCRILSKHIRDGIVHGDGGELAVSASDPPAMTVEVATGTAMVQGRFCENDAALTLAVPAADTTYPRIDRVVVRLSVTPGRTIDILVKKGTPAPSPVPPGLTRTPETWELSLAQIFVAAGAKMVQSANITDERGNASLCGVAAPAYVPSSQVEVVGAINVQGHALTGLPVPSGATDAARRDMGGKTLQNLGTPVNASDAATKGYTDAMIGGFDLSQITIVDRDWGGKQISNIGAISSNVVRVLPEGSGDPAYLLKSCTLGAFRATPDTNTKFATFTIPTGYVRGSVLAVTCSTSADVYGIGQVSINYTFTIAVAGGESITFNGQKDSYGFEHSKYFTGDLPVKGGDLVEIWYKSATTHNVHASTVVFYGRGLIPSTVPPIP